MQCKESVIASATTWIPEAIRYDTDVRNGAEIEQLTSEPVTSTNIYCEQRFTSADGQRIAIQRTPFSQPAELWVCDLSWMKLARIGQGVAIAANAPRNAIYYVQDADHEPARLVRLDLSTLNTQTVWQFEDAAPRCGAVSPDERWFVCGPYPVSENVYSLRRLDLVENRAETCCELADMFNPHMQFNPADGRQLVVQVNRGGRRLQQDGARQMADRRGATLSLVDLVSGDVSPLPVGRPDTPGISGHECWLGETGQLLFTAGHYRVSASAHVTLRTPPTDEQHMPSAAIYSIIPGAATATVLAQGLLFNHVAASDDGRFFIADDHASGRIYIGSAATGQYLPLCDSHTRQGTCQHSHAHAYMTPDQQHVIFNSIVTGVPQVYAARIPDGFLDRVLNARASTSLPADAQL